MSNFKFVLSLAIGLAILSTSCFAAKFTLNSPDLNAGKKIPEAQVFNDSGCNGQNISPSLQWNNVPAGTNSFAVTMYDPDAQNGKGWWHWAVLNLPATVTQLAANAGNPSANLLPNGAIQVRNSFGNVGYSGPCPPKGETHHYIVTVYALKNTLSLDSNSSYATVNEAIKHNEIAESVLVRQYHK